jgi:phosphoribosylaminoimidazolecarboxamide formyltransferase/IMP cyclohydrolase
MQDLIFAWKSVARCRSNSVLIAKDLASVGIGVAEVNRLDAARDALRRAGEKANGAFAASDGFFPFPDGLEALAEAGVKAVVAPGGSIRDAEVIEVAKRVGVTLYFATRRHFSHS